MRILFVLNPVAGGASKDAWEKSIAAVFKEENAAHSHRIFRMEKEDCSDDLRAALKDFRPDRVAAIGGDGTLKFVAEMLLGSGTPIAFLPAGSANGMARELAIPTDPDAAIDVLLNGVEKKMDAVLLNGHLSIHLADLGLNARLVHYFERGPTRGMKGYVRHLWRAIREGRQLRVSLRTVTGTYHRHAWMVVFANARTYGTGAVINPGGDLFDGRFEVVLFKRRWFWEMVRMLFARRPRLDPRHTEVFSVEKAVVKVHRRAHFQVDGEAVGKTKRVEAQIKPGAVVMLMPKPGDDAPR